MSVFCLLKYIYLEQSGGCFFQTTAAATKLSEDFVKGPSISLSSKMRRLRTTQLLARLFSEAAAVLSDFDDLKNQDIIWRL